MSRSTATSGIAPQSAKTAAAPQTTSTQGSMPMEKIAMLAYQKWVKGGCKHGLDKQHWLEAEAEVKAEMTKAANNPSRRLHDKSVDLPRSLANSHHTRNAKFLGAVRVLRLVGSLHFDFSPRTYLYHLLRYREIRCRNRLSKNRLRPGSDISLGDFSHPPRLVRAPGLVTKALNHADFSNAVSRFARLHTNAMKRTPFVHSASLIFLGMTGQVGWLL